MKQRVADFIADFLVANGIHDVFTVTGGGAMHLNDAFGHHTELHCIYNHHEQASAIAAEAYARYSGRLAAVCVTSGPGGTNAITGVLGGWLDSIPMFIVSGQVKYSTTVKSTNLNLRQLGDQEFNIVDAVKPMTKFAEMVINPDDIAYLLEKSFFLAKNGRPGPVWLDIPLNVQSAIIETALLHHYNKGENIREIAPKFESKRATEVFRRINTAHRPVILAGAAIRTSGAYSDFVKLIEKINVPVVTAWNAHDLLWDDHPLFCGRPGTVGNRGGNFVVQNSDLLLVLGCRLNIRQISYNWENFAAEAFKIVVDIDPNELLKPTLTIDMPIWADCKDFIEVLNSSEVNDADHQSWLSWCKRINAKYPVVLNSYYSKNSPINPYVFMKELFDELVEGDTIVAGNGSACVCSFQAAIIKRNQRLFTNSGCAAMGYGLSAALGVAVARMGARVICLDGDGSIQMNLQELQTIIHNDLNIKIFWLNNNGYHSIRQTQMNLFSSSFCGVSKDSGISFPSAQKIASAYDIPFIRIDDSHTMKNNLRLALALDGPVIIEAVLDPEQFFEPKLSSKQMPDGSIVSPSLEDMFPFLPFEELELIRKEAHDI